MTKSLACGVPQFLGYCALWGWGHLTPFLLTSTLLESPPLQAGVQGEEVLAGVSQGLQAGQGGEHAAPCSTVETSVWPDTTRILNTLLEHKSRLPRTPQG